MPKVRGDVGSYAAPGASDGKSAVYGIRHPDYGGDGGSYGLWLDFLTALEHAFSTIATGGFSPYNDSVAHFNSLS